MKPEPVLLKTQKRGDLIAEEIKRWIMVRNLQPGDRLPKENEIQKLFSVSKATTREALKSLEVQGLITVSTGPTGGATIAQVELGRTFQLLQNYLFFQDIGSEHLYEVRLVVEPEIAATAVPHLTEADFRALEQNINFCAPISGNHDHALEQRQGDLYFHDILANACPNPFLRFLSQMISEMLRRLVVFRGEVSHQQYQRFGTSNVDAHREILEAARARDAELVRKLMHEHILEAGKHIRKLHGEVERKLVLDADLKDSLTSYRKTGNH
jgi:GntR family transcriptional repressor for pyruvate dehydrogenase complex